LLDSWLHLHIQDIPSRHNVGSQMSILFVVLQQACDKLIVFDVLLRSVPNQQEGGSAPAVLEVLYAFLLRLHSALVDDEGVEAFLEYGEVVDEAIGACEIASLMGVVPDGLKVVDKRFLEVLEVIRVKHVDGALLGPIR
jgi:hypothetical protein